MSDEMKTVLDAEEEVSVDMDESVEPTVEQPSVTEADVVAAFNDAEKTLFFEAKTVEETTEAETVMEDEVADEEILVERNDFVKRFKLDFSLDDIPDAEGMQTYEEEPEIPVEDSAKTVVDEANLTPSEEPTMILKEESEEVEEEVEPSRSGGCLTRLIIWVVVLLLSISFATMIITAVFDVTGFNRNNREADVYIPKGADTDQVAAILKGEGMINSELYFRLYVRVMKVDENWREGSFKLQADMGFPTLISTMQAQLPRKTVTVMFREGLTVPEMAQILEDNDVCSAEEFINAVRYGEFDYDFVKNLPTESDDPQYANRAYRLEGYLFPDTYEFYVDSLGETVVDRMLQNFESKISTSMLAQIEDNGWTLDQVVIMASMVQGEGDTRENMDKISRVMQNRMKPNSGYTMFQFCSTHDYANYLLKLDWDSFDKHTLHQAYNTCTHEELSEGREGLPVGAINNPGLDAFNAVLYPSVDQDIMESYYFITDKDGITRFAKNIDEHKANIEKYGLSE